MLFEELNKVETTIYLYDSNGSDKEISLEEINVKRLSDTQLLWINVLKREKDEIKKIIDALELENLSLKSILNESERPKIEIFENFFRFFIVSVDSGKKEKIKKIPIDIIVGKNFVVTIHEGEVQYFQEFREREKGESQIGELDAESFIATLLDLHIVSYFRALEKIEAEVDELDDQVLKTELDTNDFLTKVVGLRQVVSNIRRWFLPHRDVFYALSRPDFQQIAQSDSADHFRMLNEHFEHAFDAIESSRDTVLSLFDLYATKSAQKTNELVQSLTFITLIIGFTGVIAGILGMNFEVDAIFKNEYGFWITIGLMILVAVILTAFAKFMRWI